VNVDVALGGDPREVPAAARIAEENGFSAGWVPENKHDAFIALALGAASTTRLQLGSSVAVAFARNPMTIAIAANDLHLASQGRLILGLGTQVQEHIVQRFGMTWSSPAARMREFLAALRAIWASWASGERLDFRGDYYAHTLMPAAFTPGPNPYGSPQAAPRRNSPAAGAGCETA
jgi:probable F420-dependent oxidoreductase